MAAAQADRKAKLDAGRVDTVFQVGDRVLLRTKELLDAVYIGKLRPRWGSHFTVTRIAGPRPDAYTPALPRRMRCTPAVNVDRLKPFFERAGAPPAPGPVADSGQEGEHEVELLLNHRLLRGVTRYLVRLQGHTSSDDEWLREEELVHCRDKVAEYDTAPAAAARRSRRSAASRLRCATSCRPAAGGRSGRLPAADSRRVGDGTRLAGQDGAVLLARKWLGSWEGRTVVRRSRAQPPRGSRAWSGTALGRRWAPRWSTRTRCSMPPRTGRPTAGSCRARRASRPVASETTVMGLPAGTAGLKRQVSIAMEFDLGLSRVCLTSLVMAGQRARGTG